MEFLGGGHAVLQLPDACLSLVNYQVAFVAHPLEVPVCDIAVHGQQQELVLLAVFRVDDGLLSLHLFMEGPVPSHLPVHLQVLFHQGVGVRLGVPEDLIEHRLQLALIQGEGGAAVLAVFDLPGADPAAVDIALLVLGLPAIVGLSAAGAEELPRQQIGVVADALPGLHVVAAAAENDVGLVPKLLGDDGRHDLAALVLEHDPFLRREEFLLLGEHIHHLDLIPHVVALILGVGDHVGHGGVGDLVSLEIAVAPLPEDLLDLLHAVRIGGIELEELPHHLRLGLVDHQAAAILHIAEDPAVAQHHAGLDGLLMAELHPTGQLPQLVLGNGGHNGEPQLRVLVQGVDVVVLEEDSHAVAQQLPGVADGVQGVSGEAGDLLRNDQVEFVLGGVLHHAVEVLPLSGGDAGETLVNIARHKGPGQVLFDQVLVVGDLVPQRIQLLVAVRGDPGIVGNPQGDLIDGMLSQLLPHFMDVHRLAS